MTAENFRCSRCGQLVSVGAGSPRRVKCRHCGGWIAIPPVPASLARPQVGPDPGAQALRPALQPKPGARAGDAPPERGAVAATLERAVPLLASVFFHLGLALIFLFVTMVVIEAAPKKRPEGPMSPHLSKGPVAKLVSRKDRVVLPKAPKDTGGRHHTAKADAISFRRWKTDKPLKIGLGGPARPGLRPWGPKVGPPGTKFIGVGSRAHHIVYVIDRSASMHGKLDLVVREIINSVGRLVREQDFHVILFNSGPPLENPPRCLVPATRENKVELAGFLKTVIARNRTDPVRALERAFAVLKRADRRRGKLICLLTDAEFPNNEEVMQVVRRLNRDKEVQIDTFLYGHRPRRAERVMTKIAEESRGRYTFVPAGE